MAYYVEGVIACSPGLQCEASYPGFELSLVFSTLKALLPKRFRARDVAAVSRPPCFEPRGSKVEDFGMETEPTSANRRNQ